MKKSFAIANLIGRLSRVVKNDFLTVAFFHLFAKFFGKKFLAINYNFVLKEPSI